MSDNDVPDPMEVALSKALQNEKELRRQMNDSPASKALADHTMLIVQEALAHVFNMGAEEQYAYGSNRIAFDPQMHNPFVPGPTVPTTDAEKEIASLMQRLQSQAAVIEKLQEQHKADVAEIAALRETLPADPDPHCDICGDPIRPSLVDGSWLHTATGREQGFVRRPHWAEQKQRRSTDG